MRAFRHGVTLAAAILLAGCVGAGVEGPPSYTAAAPTPGAGVVVITADDGRADFFRDAFPIVSQYGLVGTWYINCRHIGESDWYATRQNIWDLEGIGWEIGNHGAAHTNFVTLEAGDALLRAGDTAQTLIQECTQTLEDMLGHRPYTIAYPYGENNATIQAMVAADGYRTAVTAWGGAFSPLSYNRYDMPRVEVTGDMSATYVCDLVRQAGAAGEVLMLLFHEAPSNFAGIAQCIAQMRDAGQVNVARAGDL